MYNGKTMRRAKATEATLETIMTESILTLVSDNKEQTQETKRIPSTINIPKYTEAYCIQTSEKSLKKLEGGNLPMEEQGKNYSHLFLRNHASKKRENKKPKTIN
jgi:hypothetical protein